MATFQDILKRTQKTDGELAALFGVNSHQVRDWRLRNSIPSEQWQACAAHQVATLEELAAAAAEKTVRTQRVA